MANQWELIEMDLDKDVSKKAKYFFYKNGIDTILCNFNNWNDNSPTEITIHNSYIDRKFIHANYCEEHDRIEIHAVDDQKFERVTLNIEHADKCKINCTKVVFVFYTQGEEIEKCKKVYIGQPEHKKGSIIIRNP
ncbi:hypothetical protein [Winogradskyella algicola]|uniref:hypothetical protein n=1 Tax=Winogradskyella algicola TaxID=2575815 RepID=UPI00110892D7|nr:hypothetical protein [Winogradskyella algicola]